MARNPNGTRANQRANTKTVKALRERKKKYRAELDSRKNKSKPA